MHFFRESLTIYQIEDSSALNLVYFEYLRNTFGAAITELLAALAKYVQAKLNGSSKGARLGFSSEKEMFNICVKIFSGTLTPDQRRFLSYLWQTIDRYRQVSEPINYNETPPCYLQHPTDRLTAFVCLQMGLRCRGRTFNKSSHIQKAVFDNNLSLLNRLVNAQD